MQTVVSLSQEFPRARIADGPPLILMANTPTPFARRKRIRRMKLAMLALLCGAGIAGLAYGAAILSAPPHATARSGLLD